MVLPEGSRDSTAERRETRSGMLVAAAALLAGGALALAVLTAPGEPTAIEETTTTTGATETPARPRLLDVATFTVAQIETGPQLDWAVAGEIPNFFAYDVLAYDGEFYVFAAATNRWDSGPGGLAAWRSPDGLSWRTLGEVITPEHKITNIAATPQGLVALAPGTDPTGFTVFRSTDGEVWARETVTLDMPSSLSVVSPQQVGGDDRLLVVAGSSHFEPTTLLEEHVEETYGVELDLSRYGYSPNSTAAPVTYTIHGPLGIPVLTVSADEMGLSEEEVAALQYGVHDPGSLVWASWDGGDWSQAELDSVNWVESIVPRGDGSLLMVGWGNTGANVWTSYDGLEWEEHWTNPSPHLVEPWGAGFIGPDKRGDGTILSSADGIEWANIRLTDHLPLPIEWNVTSIAAGDAGIAAFVAGWNHADGGPNTTPDPPVLVDGDLMVSLDFIDGRIELQHGEKSRSLGMWGLSDRQGMVVDLSTETITFTDPETDEIWGSVTFTQLTEAEQSYWDSDHANNHSVFAYSADGGTWSIQDPSRAMGREDVGIWRMEMTDEGRVIALVPSSSIDRMDVPGFEIWTAELP